MQNQNAAQQNAAQIAALIAGMQAQFDCLAQLIETQSDYYGINPQHAIVFAVLNGSESVSVQRLGPVGHYHSLITAMLDNAIKESEAAQKPALTVVK